MVFLVLVYLIVHPTNSHNFENGIVGSLTAIISQITVHHLGFTLPTMLLFLFLHLSIHISYFIIYPVCAYSIPLVLLSFLVLLKISLIQEAHCKTLYEKHKLQLSKLLYEDPLIRKIFEVMTLLEKLCFQAQEESNQMELSVTLTSAIDGHEIRWKRSGALIEFSRYMCWSEMACLISIARKVVLGLSDLETEPKKNNGNYFNKKSTSRGRYKADPGFELSERVRHTWARLTEIEVFSLSECIVRVFGLIEGICGHSLPLFYSFEAGYGSSNIIGQVQGAFHVDRSISTSMDSSSRPPYSSQSGSFYSTKMCVELVLFLILFDIYMRSDTGLVCHVIYSVIDNNTRCQVSVRYTLPSHVPNPFQDPAPLPDSSTLDCDTPPDTTTPIESLLTANSSTTTFPWSSYSSRLDNMGAEDMESSVDTAPLSVTSVGGDSFTSTAPDRDGGGSGVDWKRAEEKEGKADKWTADASVPQRGAASGVRGHGLGDAQPKGSTLPGEGMRADRSPLMKMAGRIARKFLGAPLKAAADGAAAFDDNRAPEGTDVGHHSSAPPDHDSNNRTRVSSLDSGLRDSRHLDVESTTTGVTSAVNYLRTAANSVSLSVADRPFEWKCGQVGFSFPIHPLEVDRSIDREEELVRSVHALRPESKLEGSGVSERDSASRNSVQGAQSHLPGGTADSTATPPLVASHHPPRKRRSWSLLRRSEETETPVPSATAPKVPIGSDRAAAYLGVNDDANLYNAHVHSALKSTVPTTYRWLIAEYNQEDTEKFVNFKQCLSKLQIPFTVCQSYNLGNAWTERCPVLCISDWLIRRHYSILKDYVRALGDRLVVLSESEDAYMDVLGNCRSTASCADGASIDLDDSYFLSYNCTVYEAYICVLEVVMGMSPRPVVDVDGMVLIGATADNAAKSAETLERRTVGLMHMERVEEVKKN